MDYTKATFHHFQYPEDTLSFAITQISNGEKSSIKLSVIQGNSPLNGKTIVAQSDAYVDTVKYILEHHPDYTYKPE